jgi:hypothetical protein
VTDEARILHAIDAKGSATRREIEQFTGMNSLDVQNALDVLLDIKDIVPIPDGRTTRYQRHQSDTTLMVPA